MSVNTVLFLGALLFVLYLAASGRLDGFAHALATGHAKAIGESVKGLKQNIKGGIVR